MELLELKTPLWLQSELKAKTLSVVEEKTWIVAHFLHASVVDREILVIDWPGRQTSPKFNGSEIQGVN